MGMDMLHSTPFLRSPRDIWSPAFTNLADLRPSYPSPSLYLPAISAVSAAPSPSISTNRSSPRVEDVASRDELAFKALPSDPSPEPTAQKPSQHPNLINHKQEGDGKGQEGMTSVYLPTGLRLLRQYVTREGSRLSSAFSLFLQALRSRPGRTYEMSS